MFWMKILVLGAVLALIASGATADQVVWQEDFSAPFVQHDWVYNNSGPRTDNTGYDGSPWIGHVDGNGEQILGHYPSVSYSTSFEGLTAGSSLIGWDSWQGTGGVGATKIPSGGANTKCAAVSNQTAYRNFGPETGGTLYLRCWTKVTAMGGDGYVYVGTNNLAAVAGAVRFSGGKVEALNGNGSGGGTWVQVGAFSPDTWYRIWFILDYSAGTYKVEVHGSGHLGGLGFRDAAASTGLGCIQMSQASGIGSFQFDDVFAGNSVYGPGPDGSGYWSETYNHKVVNYGQPLEQTWDIYPWMVYTNTDPTAPPPFKASLPAGWTAAFGSWGDQDPTSPNPWASGRGKMGFGRYMGAHGQSSTNPCLNIWASQGDMRVVGPPITTGPGVYTLTWKASIWNGNSEDPGMQYKWTDWCMWGYGYTNWCAWDDDPITKPPYAQAQTNQIATNRFWNWLKDPFHDSDPDGIMPDRPDLQHPAAEEPGQWHSYSRQFTFGAAPVKGEEGYDFNQEPGYFVGFNVSHAHDANNHGYQWATILNVDDIVLTKKDPVPPKNAKKLPAGTDVEITDLVITNMAALPSPSYPTWVDIYLEKEDRSGAILLRSYDYGTLYNYNTEQFTHQIGERVNLVGEVYYTDAGVCMISGIPGTRLPSIVSNGSTLIDVKPVAMNSKMLAGEPFTDGLNNDAMLVTVFGTLHNIVAYPMGFFVEDGGKLPAGETYPGSGVHATGVKVDMDRFYNIWDTGSLPAEGTPIAVTGTLTVELGSDGHTLVRVLYPRSPDDIVTY